MNYKDTYDEGNKPNHLTGEICIEEGCENLAGTYWSPLWCIAHNIERMDRINESMNQIERLLNKE